MVPYLSSHAKPWFAFLVHPRNLIDVDRTGIGPLLRHYSTDEADCRRKVASIPPLVTAQLRFAGSAATGEVISIPRFPEQMLTSQARRWVIDGALVAASRGARVVGLGALTSPATGSGLTLVRELPRGVTVTNGNALTSAIVRQNVREAAAILGLGVRARVAVVGCTGSVGDAAARLLAREGYALTLIGRTADRVVRAFNDLEARFSGSISDVVDCDIVVLLTSDATARLEPSMTASGTIVIDCAQPPNVPAEDREPFRRAGVSVVEGGLVRIAGCSMTDDLGIGPRNAVFACLAETYLFARTGIREHSVGRPPVEQALRMERIASGSGVTAVPISEQLVRHEVCA